jgi:hypothetical protein
MILQDKNNSNMWILWTNGTRTIRDGKYNHQNMMANGAIMVYIIVFTKIWKI